ncbi:hypothetical protein [Rathayibacter festucae]|uniref:Bulb-type lectin domain-containing protein n=1 Tax=Rathayibacter festucae DSM 15932 TaxID=1328866 RepID=A0A3Q9UWM1_9MICO|nr:hypothetical protein [Rathayibacter festucae]AZZ52219.1 hypothetical protein C1I64_09250 [Rathayibacter festucae DSM 15932]
MILSTRGRLAAVVLATTLTCGAVAGPALAAPPALHAETAAAAVATGDRLAVGATLKAGEELRSNLGSQGVFRFVMQTDGNAVVYDPNGGAFWVSGTSGAGNSLTLQRDGNIVIYSAQGAALWASGSNGRGEPAFLAIQSDGNLVSYSATAAPLWASRGETTLVEGRQLDRGQALASADGRYRAVYQNDGNLVVIGQSGVRWSAGTSGGTRLALEAGDLVSYQGGAAVWFTGTSGFNGAQLVLQNDGNLVLYSSSFRALWSSDGGSPAYRDSLVPGAQLSVGQFLRSRGGDVRTVLQSDGNVVVYYGSPSGDVALWSTGTSGAGNRFVMQNDGNAVVYSASGRALWSSGTGSNPGSVLTMQNDGNLVVRSADGRALWDWQPNGYAGISGA